MNKLETAIKYLKEIHKASTLQQYRNYPNALQLGIEALERINWVRNQPYTHVSVDDYVKPLPSETSD